MKSFTSQITKGHPLHDSIGAKYQKWVTPRSQGQGSPGPGGGNGQAIAIAHRFKGNGVKNFWNQIMMITASSLMMWKPWSYTPQG